MTFKVKNYRLNGPKRHTTMTLATEEFIRRFLIHVLPKGQHRIRHYGFFGNGNRVANIARIRDLLGAKPPNRKDAGDTGESDNNQSPRILALPCPCCGGQLIIINTFAAHADIPEHRRDRQGTPLETRAKHDRLHHQPQQMHSANPSSCSDQIIDAAKVRGQRQNTTHIV